MFYELNHKSDIINNMEISNNPILSEAHELEKKGEFQTAIQKYKQLLRENPKSLNILQSIGKCYLKQKDYSNALYYFQKVSRIYPSEEIFYHEAECLLALRRNLEAIQSLKKVIGINPAYVKASILLSKIYAQLGNYYKQEKYLQMILRTDPKNRFALKEMALLCEKTNRPAEGLTHIEGYIYQKREESLSLEILRVKFLLQMGKYATAWEHLSETMQTHYSIFQREQDFYKTQTIQKEIQTFKEEMKISRLNKQASLSFKISLLYLMLGDVENSSKYLIYSKKLNEDAKLSRLEIQTFE